MVVKSEPSLIAFAWFLVLAVCAILTVIDYRALYALVAWFFGGMFLLMYFVGGEKDDIF